MARRDFIRRVISKEQYYEAYSKYVGTPFALTDQEFAELQTRKFQDDWIRPITEDEYDERFQRVSGDCVCFICGFIYYDHPFEQRLYPEGYDHQLCNGWIGHC